MSQNMFAPLDNRRRPRLVTPPPTRGHVTRHTWLAPLENATGLLSPPRQCDIYTSWNGKTKTRFKSLSSNLPCYWLFCSQDTRADAREGFPIHVNYISFYFFKSIFYGLVFALISGSLCPGHLLRPVTGSPLRYPVSHIPWSRLPRVTRAPAPYPGSRVLPGLSRLTQAPALYPVSRTITRLPRFTRSPALYSVSRALGRLPHVTRSPVLYPVSRALPGLPRLTRSPTCYPASRALTRLPRVTRSPAPYPGSRMLPGLPRLTRPPALHPVSRALTRLPRVTQSPAP